MRAYTTIPEVRTGKHRNARITTFTASVDPAQCSEQILLVDTELSGFLQGTSEHVEEKLAVGVGVDMSMRHMIQMFPELRSVDNISIL